MDPHDGMLGMSEGASPNFQDRLHSLMEEADLFTPGSQERTASLENIRSMLADKGTTMRRRLGAEHEHPLSFGSASREHHHGGSAGNGGFMQGGSLDDGHMLDDLYHDGVGQMMSSIPEKDSWNSPHYSASNEYDCDIEGTFTMDDVGDAMPHSAGSTSAHQGQAFPHVHVRGQGISSTHSHKQTVAAGASMAHHHGPTTAARILGQGAMGRGGGASGTAAGAIVQDVGFAAATVGGVGAASVLSSGLNMGKSAPVAAGRPPVARPANTKNTLQMSNLAREEQAAIPHVASEEGAPVVPMQPEPDKRLSHKEVEQRRREKAKQYFDELRGLLPYGGDSAKFDKNAILHHSIALIKQLLTDLDAEERAAGVNHQEQQVVQQVPNMAEFRVCFDVTRQPLCFAGLDSRVWEANAAFCTLMGYTRLEIGGLSLLTATAPSDADASQQQWQHMLAQSAGPGNSMTSTTYCSKLQRKDSQQVTCNVDLSLIRRNGKPHAFLVAANPSL
mmetsp:Transcript_4941/g.11856  ORF Transcript_4941/g.11856 Transcript_4941/m.11856 type:complete len:503 (-) Transcript_4941:104-1612(-)